jgi:tRNA/tmRNA/rRNA uracil-C5-methylase (TrmA/RlmC/RlmD family)
MISRSIIKYSFLLLTGGTMIVAHGNDLITFGKNCLIQEAQLNKAQLRLDQLAQNKNLNRIKANQAQESLEYYQDKQADLEVSMADCAATTPNSAYCHQIRRQYNELTQLIHNRQNTTEIFLNPDKSDFALDINQANFNIKHENFLALCRDSDTHYALIQNPEAYSAVCLVGNNKDSITCSLF